MANEKNLRKPYSPSEARENGAKGGKASGESKRRKKAFREAASELMRTVISDPALLEQIRKQGFTKGKMTYQEAMVAGMVFSAICGNPQAYKAIKDTVEPPGENTIEGAIEKLDKILAGIGKEAERIMEESDDGSE